MARTSRSAAISLVLLLAAACGNNDSDGQFEVTSEVVSHETTQDIMVFAPDAEGSWPMIMAYHGFNGTAEDMTEIATRLAREGFVVFAPTYRTDLSTEEGFVEGANDAECGYRFSRSIASDYGVDLDQPVTFVGWSLGASFVLAAGLTEAIDPAGEFLACSPEVPRADVVVAISGCHYEFEGAPTGFDLHGTGNTEAEVLLLAGDDDTTCAASQSEDAAAALRSDGYDVDLVMLEGANHDAPVFHDRVDGEWVVVPDDPSGEQAVEAILDAIAVSQERP